jgi:hypothetical protein
MPKRSALWICHSRWSNKKAQHDKPLGRCLRHQQSTPRTRTDGSGIRRLFRCDARNLAAHRADKLILRSGFERVVVAEKQRVQLTTVRATKIGNDRHKCELAECFCRKQKSRLEVAIARATANRQRWRSEIVRCGPGKESPTLSLTQRRPSPRPRDQPKHHGH